MQFGFGKCDITPRVGVELLGYGPFLCRHSTAVRDPLFARAMAVSGGDAPVVLVSCDLVGVSWEMTQDIRARVAAETGISEDNVLVHGIHTHSGPVTFFCIGWGVADPPYLETLPVRVAAACVEAVRNLQPATLRHAVVPCEGIGYNREEEGRPELADALREDWRPAKPELTDTVAQVLTVQAKSGELLGFATHYSCHPVIGSQVSHYIHGDYAGVATNLLEREHPGATGLFLQGCHGNINTCVVHHGEQESLQALDVIASRYARQVRPGIATAGGAQVPALQTSVQALRRLVPLTYDPVPEAELRDMLAQQEATLKAPGASDADGEVRMAAVYKDALGRELARLEAGGELDPRVEIQGFRMGELLILGAPFEIMLRYKRRVEAAFDCPVLVLSLCNGCKGYAPEKECFEREGNYAARMVPYLLGNPPFASSIEDELVGHRVALGEDLRG